MKSMDVTASTVKDSGRFTDYLYGITELEKKWLTLFNNGHCSYPPDAAPHSVEVIATCFGGFVLTETRTWTRKEILTSDYVTGRLGNEPHTHPLHYTVHFRFAWPTKYEIEWDQHEVVEHRAVQRKRDEEREVKTKEFHAKQSAANARTADLRKESSASHRNPKMP